jgi:alpha-glucosidase
VGSRVGTKNIDGYNMLIMFLPGITINFMGEEIGQEDGEVTCEQGQDPSAIGNCTTFNQTSRDFERTPFQWDNSVNAGFNDGAPTWLPVSEKYKDVNLANQVKDNRSHYHIYLELVALKAQILSCDVIQIFYVPYALDVLIIVRANLTDNTQYLLVFNMGEENQTIRISESYNVLVRSGSADYLIGDTINDLVDLRLKPGDSIILMRVVSIWSKLFNVI